MVRGVWQTPQSNAMTWHQQNTYKESVGMDRTATAAAAAAAAKENIQIIEYEGSIRILLALFEYLKSFEM